MSALSFIVDAADVISCAFVTHLICPLLRLCK